MFISHHVNIIIISLQADHIIVWKNKDSLLLNIINMKKLHLNISLCLRSSEDEWWIIQNIKIHRLPDIIIQELKTNKDNKGKTPHDLYIEHCYSLPL